MDDDGILTDELEATMRRLAAEGRTVKLIYTIASFHNPTGVAMSLERRQLLLRIAAEHAAFVLDDDATASCTSMRGRRRRCRRSPTATA